MGACTEFVVEKEIRYLGLFTFSQEKWERTIEEIEGMMRLMIQAINNELPLFKKNNIRLKTIGHFSRLSPELLNEINECMAKTENNNALDLIIFLSYSGKWDITQAVNKYLKEFDYSKERVPNLSQETISSYLSTYPIPDPDLLIRTSGEKRISNYLLWQTAYTEFYFTNTLWPDFRKVQFGAALEEFGKRDRRFGKI